MAEQKQRGNVKEQKLEQQKTGDFRDPWLKGHGM